MFINQQCMYITHDITLDISADSTLPQICTEELTFVTNNRTWNSGSDQGGG